MTRKALLLLLFLALAVPPAQTETAKTDADVAKGIAQVDDGDYDGAILTLDNAARRLAADPKRFADLSQAYLYLGIAYIGKGHEAAAKAKFREAIAQIRSLSLSPDKFPPKVIDLFEAAKAEENRNAPATAGTAPAPAPKVAAKKGGSGKVLLIVGGIAAAGGIAAVAAGGGGGSSSPATTLPADNRMTEMFTGSICGYGSVGNQTGTCFYATDVDVVVSRSGTLDAIATWADGTIFFQLSLYDQTGTGVADSRRITSTSSQLTATVTPQTSCSGCAYHIQVSRSDEKGSLPFNLVVKHP